MFQFDADRMYQMPVHFGPACGPRQGPDGGRLYRYGAQESTQHILVYETDSAAVDRYLPEGFELRMPYIIVTHKMHRNLPWLAGRGYNVVTFNVPVTYFGKAEKIRGQYQLAIWENHADPIICGREQLGYSKVFAEIEDIHSLNGQESSTLRSWDFPFLTLSFDLNAAPECMDVLQEVLQDPDNEGLLHYKYIPFTGNGFCTADVECVTLSPKKWAIPEDCPKPAPEVREWCGGSLQWNIPSWEDMPTQFHIVQGLASLPIKRFLGASRVTIHHYNDVYDQRIVR